MAKRGNRYKLDKAKIKLICDAIAIGAPKVAAAGYASISVSSLMHWLQEAREEEERIANGAGKNPSFALQLELLHGIEQAQAELAVECLTIVQKARDRNEVEWAWKMLSVQYRKEFGPVAPENETVAETAKAAVLPHIPPELIAKPYFDAYRDIIGKKYREYPFGNGRGTIKSTFVYGLMFPYLLINNPNIHGLILRQKEKDLRTSVFAQVKWGVRQFGLEHLFKFTVSPIRITYKPTGQTIYFSGADDPSSLKSIKPDFGYIGLLGFEEFDQFHGEEAVRNIIQSAIRGGEDAWIFETWNTPRSVQNWVNQWMNVPKDSRRPLEKFSYLDVPREWLGQMFIDEAEHLKLVNPTAYEHEYMGVAVGNGGQVFENLEERTITDEEIKNFEYPRDGIDWGFFPDPFVWGRSYYNPARMILYIYDEYVVYKSSNKDSYDWLSENGKISQDIEIIADSAEPKSVNDFSTYGANIVGAEKGPDSVKYSYKWLQSRVKIVIDPVRCPVHAKEFRECEHEQTKDGEFIGAYPDKNNHTIDRTRYAHNREWREAGK